MAVYFVLGSILVAWGLGLAILGLLREDFPPSGQAGRALVGVTAVIVAATLVALLATTEREHPREEAAAEAAERKAEQQEGAGEPAAPAGGAPEEQPPPAPPAEPGTETVNVVEKEFSIALDGGNSLKAGRYTFVVENQGKIQHDLEIEGNRLRGAKTKLIDGGESAELDARLRPAKYKFYCTVPGHEQAGMRVNVTVTK